MIVSNTRDMRKINFSTSINHDINNAGKTQSVQHGEERKVVFRNQERSGGYAKSQSPQPQRIAPTPIRKQLERMYKDSQSSIKK